MHATNYYYCGFIRESYGFICLLYTAASLLYHPVDVINIHNSWPRSFITFQDINQTPSHQNRVNVRAVQDAYPSSSSSSSTSAYPSVASCISDWEQRFPVDSSSKDRQPGTPQYRSRTPAICSVGRRRGQRWVADSEAPATVYGLDLEAGTRVSVCVCFRA